MKISERQHKTFFFYFLCLLSSTIIFREISQVFFGIFVLYNVFFFKRLEFSKKMIPMLLIISSPLLLDILFFWNNESLYVGLKHLEKRTLLLLLPLIVLSVNQKIDLEKLLRYYSRLFVFIMTCCFIWYTIAFNHEFSKYLKGIHLWEMGYRFSDALGLHAPAMNLHMAFASIVSFYFFVKQLNKKENYISYLVQFFLSLFLLLYLNTRMAIIVSVLSYIIVLLYEVFHKKSLKLSPRKIFVILGFVAIIIISFLKMFPYSVKKFTSGSFSNMDMIGRLDEFENPESQVYNKLVTRLSIWKSAYDLSKNHLVIGAGASDGLNELTNYYRETDQKFLAKYNFPVHNQYLDFLLKFGILGLLVVVLYIFSIGFIGFKLHNSLIISFFVLFFMCNLTDDFLIRYDGIVFSGFWFTIFANEYLNKQKKHEKG